MARQELGSLLSPQVPIQNRGIDRRQIHHHQGVQRISEVWVDVESKQFRVQFQILAQQYGNAFSLHFGIYSRCGSKWTMRLLGLVWSHSDRWRKMALPHDVNAETEDHGPILSALKARDLRAASKALERHIELSVQALQQTLPADR